MSRLTFRNSDGSFDVRGMNETNEIKKVIACVGKLADYEDTGKEPNECQAPDLCVGSVLPNGYTVDANFCNLYILASRSVAMVNTGDHKKEYAVWHLDAIRATHSGKYCKSAEEAQRYFAWLCFDWFTQKEIPQLPLVWTDYGTHKVARYNGWLLVHFEDQDEIQLFLPDDDWDDAVLVSTYSEITGYEPEWEVSSEKEAVEFIDSY